MSNSSSAKRLGRPPGADADKTRAAILDAALSAFAERGYEGASIREITSAVGVGHNMVRHYFGSKEELWKATVQHGLGSTSARISEMFEVGEARPLRPTLRAGLELLMEEVAANPEPFRLFLAEALRGGPRFEEMYDDILEPIARAIFEYAVASDELSSEIDLRVVGVFVFGAAFSPLTFEGLAARLGFAPPRRGQPLDNQIEQLIDMIVAGMAGG